MGKYVLMILVIALMIAVGLGVASGPNKVIEEGKTPIGVEVNYTFESMDDKTITVCASVGDRVLVIKRFGLYQPQKNEYITRVLIPESLKGRVTNKSNITLQCHDPSLRNVQLLEYKYLY